MAATTAEAGDKVVAKAPPAGVDAGVKAVHENAATGKNLTAPTEEHKSKLEKNGTLPPDPFKFDAPAVVKEAAKANGDPGKTTGDGATPGAGDKKKGDAVAATPFATTGDGAAAKAAGNKGDAFTATPAPAIGDAAVAAPAALAAAKGVEAIPATASGSKEAANFAATPLDPSYAKVAKGAADAAKALLDAPSGPNAGLDANKKSTSLDNKGLIADANAQADRVKEIIGQAVLAAAKAGRDEGTQRAADGKADPAAEDKAVKSVVDALSLSVSKGDWKPVVTKTEDGKYVVNLDNGQPPAEGRNLVGKPYVASPETGKVDKYDSSPTADKTKIAGSGGPDKPKDPVEKLKDAKDGGDILDESGAKPKPPGERKPDDEIKAAIEGKNPVKTLPNDEGKIDDSIDKYQDNLKKSPPDAKNGQFVPKDLSPQDRSAVKAALLAVQTADVGYLATIVPNGSNSMNDNSRAAFSEIMKAKKSPVEFHEDLVAGHESSSLRIGGREGSLMIEKNGPVTSVSTIDRNGQVKDLDKSDKERAAEAERAAKGIALTASVADLW